MNIRYSNHSIFSEMGNVYVNPVNCVGVMGSGIARVFRDSFPHMYTEYQRICKDGLLVPGKLFVYRTRGFAVVNLPTKTNWLYNSEPAYIEAGLRTLYRYFGPTTTVMPKIGCGLGGLNWEEDVLPLIERELPESDVIIATGIAKKVGPYNEGTWALVSEFWDLTPDG